MTIAVLIVIAVVFVIVMALIIYRVTRKTQEVVPRAADARSSEARIVAVDERGRAISEAQEPADPPRDASAFEGILQDEIHDRGMEQPPADDQA